jgi:hypothetical protein
MPLETSAEVSYREPLSEEYIATALRDARRFMGSWAGTSGNLAAHTVRLINERKRMLEATRTDGVADGAASGAAIAAAWEKYKRDQIATDGEPISRRVYGANGDADHQPAVGTTAKFGTGAVRSDTFEEFRYDLVSPIGLREVARTCAEGAAKYSDYNWERGMPVHDLLNHAIAHIYAFLSGDRSEPHLPHAAWNLLAAIHSAEVWPDLNAGTLREDGCKAPKPR